MQRNKMDFLTLFVKGTMMGAADAVPGVSGGTIAFITGIYQELIQTLSKLGPSVLPILYQQGFAAGWRHINGNFLGVLLCGMLTSIILLSNAVLHLLSNYPQMLWGFFFGLICASTVLLSKSIEKWDWLSASFFILGTASAYYLTTLSTTSIEPALTNVFFSGMLAICAMILPGISGSFILLLLGMYSYILGAVKNFDLLILGVFSLGCVAGLLCFSKLLSWLFSHYKNITMALLTGFLLGSLNKVWPWKETLTTRLNSHGEQVADLQQNVSPFDYQLITGIDASLLLAMLLAVIGAALVLGLEKLSK